MSSAFQVMKDAGMAVEPWMMEAPRLSKQRRRQLAKKPIRRKPIIDGLPNASPRTTQILGQCDAEFHMNCVYLHCPGISGFIVRGPAPGSSSCVAVLHVQGNYGDIITSNLSPEASVSYAPPGIQSYLTFTLKDATGKELDMNGEPHLDGALHPQGRPPAHVNSAGV